MRSGLQTNVRFLILSLLLLASFGSAAAMAPPAPAAEGVPSVAIQKRRAVIVRTGKIARDFPEKKRAVVIYPAILGPRNSAVLTKVRALLDFKNIFGTTLAEYRQDSWLTDFGYEVNYNRNYILDITFTQSGSGAYPDTHTKHFIINLRNGELIKADEAFDSASLEKLAAMVDEKLQTENRETIRDVGAEDRESAQELLKDLKFKVEHLSEFSVNDKGVTFLFDAEFPHAVQAFQPVGRYFFSYAQLKPYIKRDGPLTVFIR